VVAQRCGLRSSDLTRVHVVETTQTSDLVVVHVHQHVHLVVLHQPGHQRPSFWTHTHTHTLTHSHERTRTCGTMPLVSCCASWLASLWPPSLSRRSELSPRPTNRSKSYELKKLRAIENELALVSAVLQRSLCASLNTLICNSSLAMC
jgi:hypothetical protein